MATTNYYWDEQLQAEGQAQDTLIAQEAEANYKPSKSEDKSYRLTKLKEDKLARLGENKQHADLSDGHTIMPSGTLESNSNKIWNELTPEELQYVTGYATSKYYNPIKDSQEVRRLYDYGTKDGDSKVGVSTGGADTSDVRYDRTIDEKYDEQWRRSGPTGPDLDNKQMDIGLDYNAATALEGIYHGNKRLLEQRKYEDYLSDEALNHEGGVSEYYKGGIDALMGDASEYTLTPERELELQQYFDEKTQLPGAQSKGGGITPKGMYKEAKQTVAGAFAGLGKGAVELVDALQELGTYGIQEAYNQITGENVDIDLIDDEFKEELIKGMDSVVGYDREDDEVDMQKALQEIEASGIDITSWDSIKEAVVYPDKRKFLSRATLRMLQNPSLTASMITEIVGAGGALGAGVKVAGKVGAKVAPKLTETLSRVTTSNRTKTLEGIKAVGADTTLNAVEKAAKISQIKAGYNKTAKVVDLLKGTVYTNADMMTRVNKDLEEYEKNNDEEPADIGKVLQVIGVNRLLSSAEVGSAKIGFKVGGELNDATKKVLENAYVAGVAHLAKSAGLEAAQETMDSIGEQINQKLGSKDYEGKTIEDVLKEASAEIVLGTVAGGAGGVHVAGAGLAKDAVVSKVKVPEKVKQVVKKKPKESAGKYANYQEGVESYKVMKGAMKSKIKQNQALSPDELTSAVTSLADIEKHIKDPQDPKARYIQQERAELGKIIQENARRTARQTTEALKRGDEQAVEQVFNAEAGDKQQAQEQFNEIIKVQFSAEDTLMEPEVEETVEINTAGLDDPGEVQKEKPKSDTYNAAKVISIMRNVAKKNGLEFTPEMEAQLKGSERAVKATQKLLKKTVNKVEREVLVDEETGVYAHYKRIMVAEEELKLVKDAATREVKEKELEKAKSKLQEFAGHQLNKEAIIDDGIASVLEESENAIGQLVLKGVTKAKKIDGKYQEVTQQVTEEDAIDMLIKQEQALSSKGKYDDMQGATIKYTKARDGETYKVTLLDVLKKKLDPEYSGGVYGLLASVQETNKATNELLSNEFKVELNEEQESALEAEKVQKQVDTVTEAGGDATVVTAKIELDALKKELNELEEGIAPKQEIVDGVFNKAKELEDTLKSEKAKLKRIAELPTKEKLAKEIAEAKEQLAKVDGLIEVQKQRAKQLTKPGVFARIGTTKGYINKLKKLVDGMVEINTHIVEVATAIKGLWAKHQELKKTIKKLEGKLGKESRTDAQVKAASRAEKKKALSANKVKKANKLVEKQFGEGTTLGEVLGRIQTLRKNAKKLVNSDELVVGEKTYKQSQARAKQVRARIRQLEDKLTGTNQTKIELSGSLGITYGDVTVKVEDGQRAPVNVSELLGTKKVGATKLSGLGVDAMIAEIPELQEYKDAGIAYVASQKVANPTPVVFGDSPVQGMLYDAEGQPNEAMATAIALVAENDVALNNEMLDNPNEMKLAKRFGVQVENITPEMRAAKVHGDMRKNYVASLGRDWMDTMGITDEGMDYELYAKIVADVGQMILGYQLSKGWVKELESSKIPAEEYIPIAYGYSEEVVEELLGKVAAGDKETINKNSPKTVTRGEVRLSRDEIVALREKLKPINDGLGIVTEAKGPSFEPIDTTSEEFEARNRLFGKTAKESQDALKKLTETAYKVNINAANRLFAMDKEKALGLMGWRPEEVIKADTKLSHNKREEELAQIVELENSYDELKALVKSDNGDKRMWFNWFFSKNGRFNMDSVTINPQTEKQLHRFLVSMEQHTTTFDPKNDEQQVGFAYAVAQGLGVSIDKMGQEAVIAEYEHAQKNMPAIEKALLSEGKYVSEDGKHKFEIEHLGHTMQVIEAMDATTNGTKKAEMTVSVEFDGTTNGFANKGMQTPVRDTDIWEEKFGLFRDGSRLYGNIDQVGKLMNGDAYNGIDGITDAYKTLVAESIPTEDSYQEYINERDEKAEGGLSEGAMKALQHNNKVYKAALNVMPAMEENGKVTGFARNLLKYPFMIFGYAGGMRSIKKGMATELAEKMVADIVADPTKAEHVAMLELLSVDANGKRAEGLGKKTMLEALKTKPLKSIMIKKHADNPQYNVTVESVLVDIMTNTMGKKVEDTMMRAFGNLVEVNDATNALFQEVTELYVGEFEKKLEEVKKDKEGMQYVTSKELKAIAESLHEIFPMITAPIGESLIEGILVYDTEAVGSDSYSYGQAKTRLNGKKYSIDSVLRKVKAAQRAGAVLPIHFIDASVMARTINAVNAGVLGIHDAILMGIEGHVEALTQYNKHMIDINKDYSITAELVKLADRVTTYYEGTKEAERLLPVVEEIKKQNAIVALDRYNMYTKNFELEQMVGPIGGRAKHIATPANNRVELQKLLEAYEVPNAEGYAREFSKMGKKQQNAETMQELLETMQSTEPVTKPIEGGLGEVVAAIGEFKRANGMYAEEAEVNNTNNKVEDDIIEATSKLMDKTEVDMSKCKRK